MMLGIGAKKSFTLVEVMFAAAILSLGAVMIYEALLISTNAFNYYRDYLYMAPDMDEKIWQAQDNLGCFGPDAYVQPAGVFTAGNKTFSWRMEHELSYEARDLKLYKIKFSLPWDSGGKSARFSRDAYAVYREKK